MDSGKESSRFATDHHADDTPASILESRGGWKIYKQILFGSVRFGAYSTETIPGEVEGTIDLIHRRTFRIQRG